MGPILSTTVLPARSARSPGVPYWIKTVRSRRAFIQYGTPGPDQTDRLKIDAQPLRNGASVGASPIPVLCGGPDRISGASACRSLATMENSSLLENRPKTTQNHQNLAPMPL